jgi:hypothetical protein
MFNCSWMIATRSRWCFDAGAGSSAPAAGVGGGLRKAAAYAAITCSRHWASLLVHLRNNFRRVRYFIISALNGALNEQKQFTRARSPGR